jgi:AraC-like DNA-binding protein
MAHYFWKDPQLPFAECRYSTGSRQVYKPHIHKLFCVGAVSRGEVGFQIEETVVKLEPGSLALINPETLHSCNPTQSNKRSYAMLFLDVAWCLRLQQSIWSLEKFRPVGTFMLRDNSLYQKYLTTIQLLKGDEDVMEKEQALAEMVENIFLQACQPATVQSEPSFNVEQMKQQLSSNLDKDITMDRIALKLQANPFTLLRRFKADMGITPHAYRTNCRIELAKTLLQQGIDISQVAQECGFFDQSHFHRHFKAITTVTPKTYQVNFIQ